MSRAIRSSPSSSADSADALAMILGSPSRAGAEPHGGQTTIDSARPDSDLSCGWLDDGRERADTLILHLKTGAIGALPYGWIDFAEFEPSTGIILHARGRKVTIRGRNLNRELPVGRKLFQGIVDRRVTWIKEADRTDDLEADEAVTVVESINW